MTITRVGAASTTSAGGSIPLTAAYSQPPTAGNLLTLGVSAYSSSVPTCTTPAGWTAGPSGGGSGGGYPGRIFLFWKVAAGGDAAPNMTVSVGGGSTNATIEEWANSTGWPGSPHDVDSALGINNQASTAAGTCNPGPVTTTAPGFIWSFLGVVITGGLEVLTWGGGSTPSSNILGSNNEAATAIASCATAGTYATTLAFAGGPNWYNGAAASMAFITSAGATALTGTAALPLAATMTGAGTVTAGAATNVNGVGALPSTATLAASGTLGVLAGAALALAVALTGSGTTGASSTSSILMMTTSTTASGNVGTSGTAAVPLVATLTAAGTVFDPSRPLRDLNLTATLATNRYTTSTAPDRYSARLETP